MIKITLTINNLMKDDQEGYFNFSFLAEKRVKDDSIAGYDEEIDWQVVELIDMLKHITELEIEAKKSKQQKWTHK